MRDQRRRFKFYYRLVDYADGAIDVAKNSFWNFLHNVYIGGMNCALELALKRRIERKQRKSIVRPSLKLSVCGERRNVTALVLQLL